MFLCWSFVLLLVQLASSVFIQTTRRPRISCPDNSWLLNTKRNSCLKALSGFILTWSDARSKCQQFGGDLVQIRDAETNKLVQSLLTKGQRYWTGMTDSNEDGTFEYLNGQNLTASFQPWAAREPNNKGGNERCVEIIGNARGAWNDKRCSKRRGLVCEVSPQSATPRPSSTTPRILITTPRPQSTTPRAPFTTTEAQLSRATTLRTRPTTTSTALGQPSVILSTGFELDDFPAHFEDPDQSWVRFNIAGTHVILHDYGPSVPIAGSLSSLPMNMTQEGCLTFMLQVSTGGTSVEVSLNGQLTFIARTTVADSGIWRSALVNLFSTSNPARLMIRVQNNQSDGTIILDDFNYYTGHCISPY